MKRLPCLLILILIPVLLNGCASFPTYESAARSKFIKANYAAVDSLLATLSEGLDPCAPALDPRTPLAVATLVTIDDLTASSRLGRTVSEQIGARLLMRGYRVTELKMRNNIFVKGDEGELLLSRELRDIAHRHDVQAVVVGTYATAKDFIYINLKMISVHNNVIIAAHDYVLPITPDVGALLNAPHPGHEVRAGGVRRP
jgi:TolB-like protein